MNYSDLLLRWASCFVELRWARVQAAAERLFAPPVDLSVTDSRKSDYRRGARRLTNNLLRLGHLEQLNAESVRAVPPTILTIDENTHYLVGARSESILKALAKARGVRVEPQTGQAPGPGVYYLKGNEIAILTAAHDLHLTVAQERGGDLIASLPNLDDILPGAPQEAVPEQSEKWNPDAVSGHSRWKRTRSDTYTPGLYRTVRKPHQWYFCPPRGGDSIRLDNLERRIAAVWHLLHGKASLTYSKIEKELSIPATIMGLPLLVDRGLILASGRLPVWDNRRWKYFNIDFGRAREVARILGTPMKEKP